MEIRFRTLIHNNKKEIIEWIKAIFMALILAYLIRLFLFEPYIVKGTSMVPALEDGEFLLVNKFVYDLNQPQRGDIVVFWYDDNESYIKRVIGLPGDIIEVKNDYLYVNGIQTDEPYLRERANNLHSQGLYLTNDFPPVKVNNGQLFVLGDNRRNSKDSRIFGAINMEQVIGKADLAFYPITKIRLLEESTK